MSEIFLIKRCGVLMPASDADTETLANIAEGETVRADIKRPRNVAFHKKYFALLDVLFDIFDPQVPEEKWYNGVKPIKNRKRFRKDIAIMTGFSEMVVDIKGNCKAEAKSISFGSMDETEFSELYSKTIDYGLARIAKGKTRAELDNWVNQILSFD